MNVCVDKILLQPTIYIARKYGFIIRKRGVCWVRTHPDKTFKMRNAEEFFNENPDIKNELFRVVYKFLDKSLEEG